MDKAAPMRRRIPIANPAFPPELIPPLLVDFETSDAVELAADAVVARVDETATDALLVATRREVAIELDDAGVMEETTEEDVEVARVLAFDEDLVEDEDDSGVVEVEVDEALVVASGLTMTPMVV